MVRKIAYLIVLLALAGQAQAQTVPPNGPREHDIYCAGMYTMSPPSGENYVISGVESANRISFRGGELVFINRGAKQGVQVGSEFLVTRKVKEESASKWFVWQKDLMRAMGTQYADLGRLRVVHVDAETSTAQIVSFCDSIQRGDIVLPFAMRQTPTFKPASKMDNFAPSNNKGMAMIVSMRDSGNIAAKGYIVYVNLGTEQGARIGNYYRIFRYQGDRHAMAYIPRGQERAVYGFGAAPAKWNWSNVPREILGEGIVLNVSQNSSTVLVTESQREIYSGDYVEVE